MTVLPVNVIIILMEGLLFFREKAGLEAGLA